MMDHIACCCTGFGPCHADQHIADIVIGHTRCRLVDPLWMPYTDTVQKNCAIFLISHPIFHIIIMDKQRYRQIIFRNNRGRDNTVPPATVIDRIFTFIGGNTFLSAQIPHLIVKSHLRATPSCPSLKLLIAKI